MERGGAGHGERWDEGIRGGRGAEGMKKRREHVSNDLSEDNDERSNERMSSRMLDEDLDVK